MARQASQPPTATSEAISGVAKPPTHAKNPPPAATMAAGPKYAQETQWNGEDCGQESGVWFVRHGFILSGAA